MSEDGSHLEETVWQGRLLCGRETEITAETQWSAEGPNTVLRVECRLYENVTRSHRDFNMGDNTLETIT